MTKDDLADLLKKAGLPPESECIGKVFAFTWTYGDGGSVRATGRIDGLEAHVDTGLGSRSFRIITSSLAPRRRASETHQNPPSLSYREEHENYGQVWPARWQLYYDDLRPLEQSGPNNPVLFEGQFELL